MGWQEIGQTSFGAGWEAERVSAIFVQPKGRRGQAAITSSSSSKRVKPPYFGSASLVEDVPGRAGAEAGTEGAAAGPGAGPTGRASAMAVVSA